MMAQSPVFSLLSTEKILDFLQIAEFVTLSELIRRWQHIFSIEFGLNQINTASLIGEMHDKLIYLETVVLPVSKDDLQECSDYCELPWEILQVPLEPLRSAIQYSLVNLKAKGIPL